MQRLITVEGYGQICIGSTLGNLPGIRVDAAGQVYSQHKGVALMQTAYQPAGSKTGRPKCTMEPGAIESIANGYHKKITHSDLLAQKKAAYPDYRKAREEMQELVKAQKNIELFFAEEKDAQEKQQTR